ncbi:MAG: hypothetical protein FWD64_13350, partial [Acidobacteriaceae bacterium]|nr:hypothetical protein [Acidobacteriaceae bacterium]
MDRREFLSGSLAVSLAGKARAFGLAASAAAGDAIANPITRVNVGEIRRYEESRGDTWIAAWAEDDNLYSPSNDTTGFRKACHTNLAFNRLEGSDPLHLSGITVNTMEDYGKAGQT